MAAVVAVVATVVAAAASAYAAYSASEAQQQQAAYQKRAARLQAKQAQDAAAAAAEQARTRNQRIQAAARARLGAAGVISSEGSPLIAQLDSAEQAALEEARIKYGGAAQATGYLSQAKLFGYQQGVAERAGYIGVGTSLLGGAAQASGIYARYNTPAPATSTGRAGTGEYG